jgi:predicted ATPase
VITKWGLKNFKSIREADLELAPLTVFTGVNSSGKSSFLQSIVMLVQSVRNEDSLEISLYGHLINLRDFEQIYCKYAEKEFCPITGRKKETIVVKFNITPIEDKPEKQIHYEFEYGPNEDSGDVCPRIHTFSMESREDKTEKNVIYLKSPYPFYADTQFVELLEAMDAVSLRELKIPIDYAKKKLNGFYVPFVRHGDSFLPYKLELVFFYDVMFAKSAVDLFVEILTDISDEKLSGKEQVNDYVKKCIRRNVERGHNQSEIKISMSEFHYLLFMFMYDYFDKSPGRDIIKKFENQWIFFDNDSKPSNENDTRKYRIALDEYRKMLKTLALAEDDCQNRFAGWHEDMSALDYNEKKKIIDIIKENSFKEGFEKLTRSRYEILNLPSRLKETRNWLFDFFDKEIKYLGPLREDPQWEYEHITYSLEIDPKGKNTAALIHILNEQRIEIDSYFSPNDLDSHEGKALPKKIFSDALYEWLNYINLSDNFRTKNLGSDKFEIKLTVENNEFAIPQLGTGVSQVLPILVICLSAAPGSTIIIEQPELHLHPKMQSRLADFFIAMALSGRQCLIETHSEYLIEQLRYRIVKSPLDNPLHKKIKIYFATKRDGITGFDDMDINEFAAPYDWPEDFFDESHKISNKIMDETIRKMDESEKDE